MNDNIITLGTYTYERAQIVQTILESDGIECFIQNVNLLQGAVSSGVKVRIHEDDLQRSMQLIEALIQPEGKRNRKKSNENAPKILLPVDFSDYSRKAADLAYDWAKLIGAEITLLHTYFEPVINTLPFSDTYMYDVNLEELSMDLKEESEKGLKRMKKYLTDKNESQNETKVVIKSLLLRGVAEDEIVNYSNLYQPTIIIMGTRGKDRKSSDLIGSVTAEVIDMAKIPVLAIPEDFPYEGLKSIKNILYATSFEESDFIAIDTLENLLKPIGVKIFCTHVVPEKRREWDEVRMEGLKNYIQEKYHESDVVCDLLQIEDFWMGIENYIQEKEISIMCITSKRRNIISRLLNPSIAKKMLFHSTTPLLVFHS